MNNQLQKLFTKFYNKNTVPGDQDRGASSVQGTGHVRQQLVQLAEKYHLTSMFDAGCNDGTWASRLAPEIKYQGGDISLGMVSEAWSKFPHLDISVHDATTDRFPAVDLLFVRDVAIHLNNGDKKRLLINWLDSEIPWLLITHNLDHNINVDFDYVENHFPFAPVNWQLPPWNFPEPMDKILEGNSENGRCMALWHRVQLVRIINDLR